MKTAPASRHRSRLLQALFLLVSTAALTLLPAAAEIRPGVNLLQNGDAESPITTGWTVTNGTIDTGTEWTRSNGGYNQVGRYFVTSYNLCTRSQTIDLIAAGLTAAELDSAPPIKVSEAFSYDANRGIADSYYLKVELRNAAGVAVASWNVGTSTARKTASPGWVVESFVFSNYGPGVRSIYFEDGSVDEGYWRGQYGVYHDAARVEFLNQPVTDITATPATFPASVPPGGLASQLTAADADNLTHTFTLEAALATTTQPLLTSRAAGWKYYDAATAPAGDWTSPAFDDSAWGTGAAPLGYDSGGTDTWKQTQISYGANASAKPLTTWFRKTFTLSADPASVVGLNCTLMVDDGCVVYLNGTELFRDGMPDGTITATTAANRTVGGSDESDYTGVTIPPAKLALLVAGTNTIAIETHQDKIGSSDISIDLTLEAVVANSTNPYDNGLFEIRGSELRLRDGSGGLADGPYTIRVKADDGAGNTFTKLLTLQRTPDVLSNPPTGFTLSAGAIAENTPADTVVGTLQATDADPGDVHAYSLISGLGGQDNSRFAILGNKLTLIESPNFETTPSLSLLIQVEDSSGNVLAVPFNLPVTDDNTEDADGDRLTEAEEDLDDDGVLDDGETDPQVADTDGDGYNDRVERNNSSDPRDPASTPGIVQVRQISTHTTGNSWLDSPSWEDATVLQSYHITVTDNMTLRPPATLDPVFPGTAAILRNNAVLRLKNNGTLTIPRIQLDNATLQHGMDETLTVGGAGAVLEIPTTATIDCEQDPLILAAGLSGAGALRVTGTTSGTIKNGRLELSAAAQNFTGTLTLEVPETVIAHPDALTGVRTITLSSGSLSTQTDISIPTATLVFSGTGKLILANRLTVAAATSGTTSLIPGVYNGARLIAAGVPAAAVDDQGGQLIIGTPATIDSDGDGWTDANEALAGTDPNDPNSVLRLASAAPNGAAGNFLLLWNAVAGITYTVQYSPELSSPWQDLGTVTPADSSGSFIATVPGAAGEKGFFRLILK